MRVRVTDAAVGFQFGLRISSTAASGAAALHDETHELHRIGAFVEGRHAVRDRDPAALLLHPDMRERFEPRRVVERAGARSEEQTSELQSLMRNSYAVFCLKKKTNNHQKNLKTTL